MGSIGDPTTAGGVTREEGVRPSPEDAAAVADAGHRHVAVEASTPVSVAASHPEGPPEMVAQTVPTTEPVGAPPATTDAVPSAEIATEAVPESVGLTAEDLRPAGSVGDSVSAPSGSQATPTHAVTAVAPLTESAAAAVAPDVAPAPQSVAPRTSPTAVESSGLRAERAPAGPGGGKRRKPGQVDVSIAPEWVPVAPPRQGSFLGGPAIWGVIAIVAVLLAGTVLSNGAFTPFAVDTVDVATNTLTSDTVPIAPGRVQTTSMTLGDLTPGTTVVRAPFSVKAEAPGTGKPMAAYVSLVSEKPAAYVRAVIFRCLDANGAPAPCDTAVEFSDAHLDTSGTTPTMIETTGGPPASATVRSVIGGDLEILDGAGNVKKGGKVHGVAPVARPAQGASAKLTDFFVVGGTTGGLGHGAQEVGVNGATATLPMVKGMPGLPPGGQSYLLAYLYAPSDTPAADAAAKVGVTVAVLAIGAEATP